MTAAYRVVVAERKDIATVTLVCAFCEAEVSLLIEKALAPDACPSCRKPYGDNVLSALAGLARFHQRAAEAEQGKRSIFKFCIHESS